jgi:hypothetical protein
MRVSRNVVRYVITNLFTLNHRKESRCNGRGQVAIILDNLVKRVDRILFVSNKICTFLTHSCSSLFIKKATNNANAQSLDMVFQGIAAYY